MRNIKKKVFIFFVVEQLGQPAAPRVNFASKIVPITSYLIKKMCPHFIQCRRVEELPNLHEEMAAYKF